MQTNGYIIWSIQRTWERRPRIFELLWAGLFLLYGLKIASSIVTGGNLNLALGAYLALPIIAIRPIIGVYIYTIILFISPLTFEMGSRQVPSPREAVGLLTLGLGILQIGFKKEELPKYNLYGPLIVVFALLLGFALLNYGAASRTELIAFSSGAFAYVLVVLFIKTPLQIKRLLFYLGIAYLLLNVGLAYHLILAVFERGIASLRSELETLGYAATSLAWLQVLFIPVILGIILTTKNHLKQLFWAMVLLLNYIVAMLSVTRGALMSILLSLIGFFLLNKRRRTAITPLLTILFLGFILFYFYTPWGRVLTVERTVGDIISKQRRVGAYLESLHRFIKSPLWGAGATGAVSHSFFLGAAGDYGLIYLIPLFWLFYKGLKNGFRLMRATSNRKIHPLCVGLFVSFLVSIVQSIFDSTFMFILYGMTFWMLRGIETVYLNTLRSEMDIN